MNGLSWFEFALIFAETTFKETFNSRLHQNKCNSNAERLWMSRA
jgi:hypothetical protein